MSEQTEAAKFTAYQLGQTAERLAVTTEAEARDGITALAAQARASLYIQSALLAPAIYATTAFTTAIADLARAHRWSQVRLLVSDADALINRGHRLITLAQRLSSYIEIRKLDPERPHDGSHCVIADDTGYAWFESNEQYRGFVDFADRAVSKRLSEQFMRDWENGLRLLDFKRLHI